MGGKKEKGQEEKPKRRCKMDQLKREEKRKEEREKEHTVCFGKPEMVSIKVNEVIAGPLLAQGVSTGSELAAPF
jgi:hypothetical protein